MDVLFKALDYHKYIFLNGTYSRWMESLSLLVAGHLQKFVFVAYAFCDIMRPGISQGDN